MCTVILFLFDLLMVIKEMNSLFGAVRGGSNDLPGSGQVETRT